MRPEVRLHGRSTRQVTVVVLTVMILVPLIDLFGTKERSLCLVLWFAYWFRCLFVCLFVRLFCLLVSLCCSFVSHRHVPALTCFFGCLLFLSLGRFGRIRFVFVCLFSCGLSPCCPRVALPTAAAQARRPCIAGACGSAQRGVRRATLHPDDVLRWAGLGWRRYALPSTNWLAVFEAVVPLLTPSEFDDFVSISLKDQPDHYLCYLLVVNGRLLARCMLCGLTLATSAPGRGSPLPHLRRDGAHPLHMCAGTGLTQGAQAHACRSR